MTTKQGMIKIIIVPNLEHLIIRKSEMEWISVDDREPRKASTILGFGNGMIYFLYYNSDGKYCLENEFVESITHWVPLPPPPKLNK